MALDQNAQYPVGTTGPSAAYPEGEAVNETVLDALDGYPWEKEGINDVLGPQQALLRLSNQVASGNADTALVSQYVQGMVELASGRAFTFDDSGAVDAYVLDVQTNQQAPAALFDGQLLRFVPTTTITGAATANPFGKGMTNIKLTGGIDDPAAGEIEAGKEITLIYRTSPGVHLELKRRTSRRVVTASGTYDKKPGLTAIFVEVIGGGASGANYSTNGGGGGGGGGRGSKLIYASALSASETVTIGAGGAAQGTADSDGNAGGTTSLGVHISSTGGGAGTDIIGGITGLVSSSDTINNLGDGFYSLTDGSGSPTGGSGGGNGSRGRKTSASTAPTQWGAGSGGSKTGGSGAGADGAMILTEFYE